jgi:hypothetical protein
VLPVVGGYLAARGSGAFAPDTIAPELQLPGDITRESTGATTPVTFTVTATDNEDPNPTVSCSPASGSAFPIGTTTVSCTATDASMNSSSGTFTVTVRLAQLDTLLTDVSSLPPGKSLADKVSLIQAYFAAGQTSAVCSELQAFDNEVSAQSGRRMTPAQASALLAETAKIRPLVGC